MSYIHYKLNMLGLILTTTSCWPTDIGLFDFYRKRGLSPDQNHYNQSPLWSRLHITLAQITPIKPKWIYTEYSVLKIFSPIRIFEHLPLALKNRVCLEIFHCIKYIFTIQDFWATLPLPWKTESLWHVSLYWMYFSHSGFLTNLRLLCKTVCPGFTLLNIHFYHLRFLNNLRLPWNFSLYWTYIFYHSGFLSNLFLPWKQILPWNFLLYWIGYTFHIQDLSNLRLPWKQSLP